MDELMRAILAICPDALFDQDENGEVTVATGFVLTGDVDAPLITTEQAGL